MGEIADDVMEGACCAWRSTYFQKDHGYPVLCVDCWDDADAVGRQDFRRAIIPEGA